MILAETAGPARGSGDVSELARDVLRAALFRLFAQKVCEISCGEAGGTTLPDVGKLAPKQKVGLARLGQRPCLVTTVLECSLDQALGAPMQASKQDFDM